MMWPERCLRMTAAPPASRSARPRSWSRTGVRSPGCQFLEVAEQAVSGIVHDDIDAAELLHRLVDRGRGLRLVRDVQLENLQVPPATSRRALRTFSTFLPVATTRSPAFNAALAVPAPMPLPGTRDEPDFAHDVLRRRCATIGAGFKKKNRLTLHDL